MSLPAQSALSGHFAFARLRPCPRRLRALQSPPIEHKQSRPLQGGFGGQQHLLAFRALPSAAARLSAVSACVQGPGKRFRGPPRNLREVVGGQALPATSTQPWPAVCVPWACAPSLAPIGCFSCLAHPNSALGRAAQGCPATIAAAAAPNLPPAHPAATTPAPPLRAAKHSRRRRACRSQLDSSPVLAPPQLQYGGGPPAEGAVVACQAGNGLPLPAGSPAGLESAVAGRYVAGWLHRGEGVELAGARREEISRGAGRQPWCSWMHTGLLTSRHAPGAAPPADFCW